MRPLSEILDKHIKDQYGPAFSKRANGKDHKPIFRIHDDLWLTERELEVMKKLCSGLYNKEIAEACSISTKTVEKHRQALYNKLSVNSTIGLYHRALELGILLPPQVHPQFSGLAKPDSDGAAVSTPTVAETSDHNSPNGTTNPSSNGHTKQ